MRSVTVMQAREVMVQHFCSSELCCLSKIEISGHYFDPGAELWRFFLTPLSIEDCPNAVVIRVFAPLPEEGPSSQIVLEIALNHAENECTILPVDSTLWQGSEMYIKRTLNLILHFHD